MRTVLIKLGFLSIVSVFAAGCYVAPDPGPPYRPNGGGGGGGGGVVTTPQADTPIALGAQGMLGYRVAANASVELPAGDIGFLVTANGNGGYQIAWTDTQGTAAHFSGTLTTDGTFDPNQTTHYSGAENITLSSDLRTISFDSTPGTAVDGVATVSSTDPIYLDAYVDGVHTGFDIVFTGAESGQRFSSPYDPVAFTSP